jgi:AraC-like DNA-binding protein
VIIVQESNFSNASAIKCSSKRGKYSLGEHIHQFSEIVFVNEGSLNVTVDGKTETANQNDIIVISPLQVHSFDTPEFCSITLFLFSNDLLPEFIITDKAFLCGERAVFTPSYELLVYIKNKIPNTKERIVGMDSENVQLFRQIKASVFAIYEEYSRNVSLSEAKAKSNLLLRVLVWMRAHFTENVTMEDAARDLGYTVGYISHCLDRLENMNFRWLLNSIRIEHARALLVKNDAKIIDIALQCGFTCERSFHRVFHSMVGLTPGEYRKVGSANSHSVLVYR